MDVDMDRELPPSAQGLADSQHSVPNTQAPPLTQQQKPKQKKTNPEGGNGFEEIRGLAEDLLALVPKERRAAARGLVAKITEAAGRLQKPGSQETITITNLQQVVTEAVRAAVKTRETTPPART